MPTNTRNTPQPVALPAPTTPAFIAPATLGPCDDGQQVVADVYRRLGQLEQERLYNFAQDALRRDREPTGHQARDYEGIEFLALFVADMQDAARADDSRAAHAAALQWQGITEEERDRLFTAWETVVSVAAASHARGMRPMVPLPPTSPKKGTTAK